MTTIARSLTQRIAAAVATLRWQDVSPERQTRMRYSALDFLGCAIGGARRTDIGPALLLAKPGDLAVPGLDQRFDAAGAALVLGTCGSLFQMHDVYLPGHIHSSSPIFPAAWAMWQLRGGSPEDFLLALVAGYEVTNRIAMTTYPVQQRAGSTPTATLGALGAAVAAGVLAGLDTEKMAIAIANAALLAPLTPFQSLRDHGSVVPIHSGAAARAGVEAVLLAEGGWSAGPNALEGTGPQPGWLSILKGDPALIEPETWDWSSIDKVIWKFLPACFASLPAIEAALRLPDIDAAQIARLEIAMPAAPMTLVAEGPLAGGGLYDQLMSVRWPVAQAVLHGAFGIETVLDAVHDPAFDGLLEKTFVVYDPRLDPLLPAQVAATIRWTLKDGTGGEYAYRRSPLATRTDGRPLGWSDTLDPAAMLEKFNRLTGHRPEEAEALKKTLIGG